jgi:carboxylesterase type B
MSRLWGAFAHAGDPAAGAPPAWPRYEPLRDELLHLNASPRVRAHEWRDTCAFWDESVAAASHAVVAALLV